MPQALEVVLRVSVIYFALLAILRVGGRKELAQLTPMDVIVMMLLSESVSPALTGGSQSVVLGLLAATTLIGLTLLIDWLTFRSRRIERLIEGRADVLIREGRVDERVLRWHQITDEQLRTALHKQGLLQVSEVRVAFVEPSGAISVIPARE